MYLYLAEGSWINSWRWRQCLLCKKKKKCFGICWSCWTWWITRFQTFQFNWKEACSPWKRNKRCLVKYGRTLTWSFKKGLRQQTTYLPGWLGPLRERHTVFISCSQIPIHNATMFKEGGFRMAYNPKAQKPKENLSYENPYEDTKTLWVSNSILVVMGPSQDSASTRLWLGIFWPTRTWFC